MPPILLVTLTKGLSALKKQVETCCKALQDKLSHSDKLSDEDEEWLDHAGKLIDHQRVFETLSWY